MDYANHVDETPTMFFACKVAIVKKCENLWYGGCNNYMIDREDLLVDIDGSVTALKWVQDIL